MKAEEKAAPPQAGAVFTKDFLIEHWKANWKLACEDYMELQAVNKGLLEALERWKKLVPISRGSGQCSSVPCFDEFDYAAERERKGWLIFDETEYKEATQITEAAIAKARGRQL